MMVVEVVGVFLHVIVVVVVVQMWSSSLPSLLQNLFRKNDTKTFARSKIVLKKPRQYYLSSTTISQSNNTTALLGQTQNGNAVFLLCCTL